MILMFFVWVNSDKEPKNKIIKNCLKISFIIFMLLNLISTFCFLFKEIKYDYSAAYQVADFINENTEENSIFITAKQPEFLTSIIPYIENNSKFYYLQSGEYFTFVTWDETITTNLDEDFDIEYLRKIFGENKSIYYIYIPYDMYENVDDRPFINKLLDEDYLTPVFVSNNTFLSLEEFMIYKINL